MSANSTYSLEPATKGCVRLKTSKGDLIIDLFAREAPENCKYFCQQCVDGKLDGAKFHRILPEVLIQASCASDETEKQVIKPEFHSRLEFRARGFVALSSDNASEFFITLQPTPWLNRKHTIIGMLRGQSVFAAVKIGNMLQENEIAMDPVKIDLAQIIEQPFAKELVKTASEAKPTDSVDAAHSAPEKKKIKLSFGEEEEDEVVVAPKQASAEVLSRDARMLAKLQKRG